MSYLNAMIYDSSTWRIFLHENQYYIGRAYFWYCAEDTIDLLAVGGVARQDLFRLMRLYQQAVAALFMPDLWNYASLGNVQPLLHVHMIPRYRTIRTFNGETFRDARWGKNYAPYPKDFHVSPDTRLQIKRELSEYMERLV